MVLLTVIQRFNYSKRLERRGNMRKKYKISVAMLVMLAICLMFCEFDAGNFFAADAVESTLTLATTPVPRIQGSWMF
jgi:hypothetical protein